MRAQWNSDDRTPKPFPPKLSHLTREPPLFKLCCRKALDPNGQRLSELAGSDVDHGSEQGARHLQLVTRKVAQPTSWVDVGWDPWPRTNISEELQIAKSHLVIRRYFHTFIMAHRSLPVVNACG